MLEFVKKAFRSFLEAILWINLIICVIIGGVFGSIAGSGAGFAGVLLGAVVGILINIIGGGLIATLINIDKNIEQLVQKDSPLSVQNKAENTIPESSSESGS